MLSELIIRIGFFIRISQNYIIKLKTLGKSKLEGYLESIRGKESRHWYNAYRILSEQEDNEDFRRQAELVGEFLCKCFASVAVKRIIYHSIFYECIALEYAYRTGQTSLAREILMSGYDFYLELDSLRILYEYDKDTFEEQIAMLKRICLTRKIAMLTSRSTHNWGHYLTTSRSYRLHCTSKIPFISCLVSIL